jgi:hypothetical protein
MSTNDRLAGVRERWTGTYAEADVLALLALVDEQAAEIAEARRALYRIMQACGIQGEASPETLAGMDVALCGEVGARNIADAWRLARQRAAEIERLRGEARAAESRGAEREGARGEPDPNRDVMPRLHGEPVRCAKCGANVFRWVRYGHLKCNACGAQYEATPAGVPRG